ncbi:histidinol-phosphate transaminase [Helicobacter anatolicus]|uniref:histidinol-phosphate transaminase n=1 Tax=Helicobacter anatolicus TaxID=2905874 RepID=UPI001E63998F|nr:histidinol-phosphate transaminase [Helicobacter anatolicus]MCE3039983.1 histidinol-phosphate transaminase [Helicobacter anatolicus]
MTFNTFLENIAPYNAGRPVDEVVRDFGVLPEDIIRLASNENPYGCSQKVIESIKNYAKNISLYPDDSMGKLKESLAKIYGLSAQNFIIGAGSDQIIEFCLRIKCNASSRVLMAKTTFAMYEIYAKQTGAKIIKTSGELHDLKEFEESYKEHGADVIFLCLPNNPLGECLDFVEVYEFLTSIDRETLVVLDGAYQEYAAFKDKNKNIDCKKIVLDFSNVIVLKTFSKAYGLGGLRIGYGIAQDDLIAKLHKIRPPFNVGSLSLEAAYWALKDEEFIQKSVENNFIFMRDYEDFAISHQMDFIPSYANFITLFCDNKTLNSTKICEKLLQKGVLVRDLASYGLNALRITIGTKEQNLKVFSLLQANLS